MYRHLQQYSSHPSIYYLQLPRRQAGKDRWWLHILQKGQTRKGTQIQKSHQLEDKPSGTGLKETHGG